MGFRQEYRRWLVLLVLSVGGGAIYLLPYLRYSYYDSLVAALDLTNTQFGLLMSVYGIANIFSYFLGGFLADRFQARYLIAFSLVGTGVLGFYYATFPGFLGSLIVHGLWSITTVMTYWAALIKAIKLLGDGTVQGRLFGFKETGFGGFALVYSGLGILLFQAAGAMDQGLGLQYVIIIYSVVLIVSGIISLFLIPLPKDASGPPSNLVSWSSGVLKVLQMPGLWLAAGIIFCAYSLHTGISYMVPYATNVFGVTAATGATLGVVRTYAVHLLACPLGGVIVDKIGSSTRYLSVAFVIGVMMLLGFVFIPGNSSYTEVVIIAMIGIAIIVSTMRGVYFVPLAELKIADGSLGVAAGALSLVGFLPDVFIYTLAGSFLDRYPAETGYELIFFTLTGFAVVGAVCSVVLYRRIGQRSAIA